MTGGDESPGLTKLAGYTRRTQVLWVKGAICIAENRLAGPFNFVGQEQGQRRRRVANCIPDKAWNELEEGAACRGMEVQSVRQIVPIGP